MFVRLPVRSWGRRFRSIGQQFHTRRNKNGIFPAPRQETYLIPSKYRVSRSFSTGLNHRASLTNSKSLARYDPRSVPPLLWTHSITLISSVPGISRTISPSQWLWSGEWVAVRYFTKSPTFTDQLQVIIGVPASLVMGEPMNLIALAPLSALETFAGSIYDDPTRMFRNGQPSRHHPLY